MNTGRIIISVFIQRHGIQEPTVHPLMSRTGRMPYRAWNTGYLSFVLRSLDYSQDVDVPNWVNNQEHLRLLWSPRWMESAFEYTGSTGELLIRTQFTFPLDGELRTDRTDFFDGYVILKYAGERG